MSKRNYHLGERQSKVTDQIEDLPQRRRYRRKLINKRIGNKKIIMLLTCLLRSSIHGHYRYPTTARAFQSSTQWMPKRSRYFASSTSQALLEQQHYTTQHLQSYFAAQRIEERSLRPRNVSGHPRNSLQTTLFSTLSPPSSSSTTTRTKTQYTIDDSVCSPTKDETLEKAVHRACRSLEVYLEKKPIAAHTKKAFEVLVEMIHENNDNQYDGIVLDSGCGTGRSTKLLAHDIHPNHLVIGVDRSIARLTKTKDNRGTNDTLETDKVSSTTTAADATFYCHRVSENAYLVRAELVDFWRCCLEHGWTRTTKTTDPQTPSKEVPLSITHHYMLYPNPYPTKARLSSRWYAHPSFPLILKLGIPTMVLRSNWEQYLIEFAKACTMANKFYDQQSEEDSLISSNNSAHHENLALPYLSSATRGPTERIDKSVAYTNFESKYDAVGESTFELVLEGDDISKSQI